MADRPAGRPVCRRRVRQPERHHGSGTHRERDLIRRASLVAALLIASPLGAQDLSLWLDATTSHAQPPAGVVGDAALYGLLGTRLDIGLDRGTVVLQGRTGAALTGVDGHWLQGSGTVSMGRWLGPAAVRGVVSAYGLRYLDPFVYGAAGIELRPSAALPIGPGVLTAVPLLSHGSWAADSVAGDLRIAGGDLSVGRALGAVTVGLTGGGLYVENGAMAGSIWRGGAVATLERPDWTIALELRGQSTPLEDEIGGGVHGRFAVAPGLELQLDVGRTLRDPLFGTQGSWRLAAGLGIRAFSRPGPAPAPLVTVGERSDSGREVRFHVPAPGAESVALVGDFTGWEPVAMHAEGEGWSLIRVLAPGLHHFGFLVDGTWAVPSDAPGVVEDGWGRLNASIVVEP